ncbi:nipped-B-like protein isoform X4 [Takifugu flavidus]|uniref:nipped-B-like protein isoform X4 n=1 Tax=Takifugu flavidus TaxID=433684 RepID=UPI0025447631|nr:nipped-B-like protein isoform X4 [Takifugu flavidus]
MNELQVCRVWWAWPGSSPAQSGNTHQGKVWGKVCAVIGGPGRGEYEGLRTWMMAVAAQSIKYGLKGQEVKLKPQIQEQQPDLILWLHNDNKVVEFNGKEEDVYDPFKNRTTLDWHSAELHLTDLRSEDSGLYELELYTQEKSYFYSYTLQVIDKVAKPTITCETNSSKSSNLSGLLTCSAPQPDIEYEWFFYGNTQPGPQLRIFLDNKHDERVYSCRVSNPLSNETAEFTAKDCYPGESSSVVLVAVLSAVVLLLVVAGVVIYRRYYKGRDNETAEDGESQLPLTSSPIKEGESQVQDEAPKQGGIRRLRDRFQLFGAQQTPANSHRNHRDFCPQSQQKRPRQGQKGSDEGDEGDEGTELDTEVVSDEPDPAVKEASDLESPTEQTGRDNETAEDGESQLPLTSPPIKEGESQVQDEAPKQGGARRRRDDFEGFGAQQTPANSHRNHRDFCPQSQQKRPRQGQKGSDEDDEGDECTELVTEVVSDEPDPAEEEASDLESPTEQTGRDNETAEDGESHLPLTFSPITEGESQVQDEAPKQGGVRRLRGVFERFGAQQTPANSHRNHRDFSPQSQQKRPRQGQKGSDEDDEGDEGTGLVTEVVSDEPDPAEEEASDLESPTEQTGRDNETAEDGESQLPLTSSPIKGRDNETAEDGESHLLLTFSPIKEGESQVQDEAPKQGGVRRLRDEFERFGAQQTPANSHRNHRDFCPQSQQKRPRQGQKGSDEGDEGDEGTDLVTDLTEKLNPLVIAKLNPAEEEASDLESPTEQTASEKENKEQFIHSAGEDREVGSAQVIKEPDTSSTEADQSVDNSSGEADQSVDNSSGEADQSVDNSSGEADKSVDKSSGEADTSDIQIN